MYRVAWAKRRSMERSNLASGPTGADDRVVFRVGKEGWVEDPGTLLLDKGETGGPATSRFADASGSGLAGAGEPEGWFRRPQSEQIE